MSSTSSTNLDAMRLSATPVPSATSAVAVPKTTATAVSATTDDLSSTPNPPRFPWLSNLGARLEQQAKQRPTFSAAPVIGDNVDLKA